MTRYTNVKGLLCYYDQQAELLLGTTMLKYYCATKTSKHSCYYDQVQQWTKLCYYDQVQQC